MMAPGDLQHGELFRLGGAVVTVGGVASGLAVFAVACVLSRLAGGLFHRIRKRAVRDVASIYVLEKLSTYGLVIVGAAIGLSTAGLNLSSLTLFAGAIGIGLGLGLQGVVKEFFSGLFLIFDPMLSVGDYVELERGVRGVVAEIGPRATRIRTNDNVNVLIPNSHLIEGALTNWTLRGDTRRIHIPFSVADGADRAKVRDCVLDAARASPFTRTETERHKSQVWLVGFSGSGLDFELLVWPTREAVNRPAAMQAAYTWLIADALDQAGIKLPLPQPPCASAAYSGARAMTPSMCFIFNPPSRRAVAVLPVAPPRSMTPPKMSWPPSIRRKRLRPVARPHSGSNLNEGTPFSRPRSTVGADPMTSLKVLPAVAAGALVLAAAPLASAQTPYSSTQQQPSSQQDAFGAILGALFGDRLGVSTSLETEWSRGRRPLSTQSAQFQSRLDADVRSGRLSSSEASRLRYEYDDLVQLEARYTADGRVTTQERADLVARYREFSQRVEAGGSDYSNGRTTVADGRVDFEARVDAAVRNRRLTRTEGTRLKTDYQDLIRVESGYLRDGRLTAQERDDLDARLDALDARVGDGPTNGGGYQDSRTRLSNIERALSSNGTGLSRTEVADIRVEVGDLTRLEAAYSRAQPSSDDRAYLERRIGELEVRARVRR